MDLEIRLSSVLGERRRLDVQPMEASIVERAIILDRPDPVERLLYAVLKHFIIRLPSGGREAAARDMSPVLCPELLDLRLFLLRATRRSVIEV